LFLTKERIQCLPKIGGLCHCLFRAGFGPEASAVFVLQKQKRPLESGRFVICEKLEFAKNLVARARFELATFGL
jgi:hypothetical protein